MKKKMLLTFVLAAILACSFVTANAAVVEYEEDFQSYTAGEIPDGFTVDAIFDASSGAGEAGAGVIFDPTQIFFMGVAVATPSVPAMVHCYRTFTTTGSIVTVDFLLGIIPFTPPSGQMATAVSVAYDSWEGALMYDAVLDEVFVLSGGTMVSVGPPITAGGGNFRLEIDYNTNTYSAYAIDGSDTAVLLLADIPLTAVAKPDTFNYYIVAEDDVGVLAALDDILITSNGDMITENPRTGDKGSYTFAVALIAVIALCFIGFMAKRKADAAKSEI